MSFTTLDTYETPSFRAWWLCNTRSTHIEYHILRTNNTYNITADIFNPKTGERRENIPVTPSIRADIIAHIEAEDETRIFYLQDGRDFHLFFGPKALNPAGVIHAPFPLVDVDLDVEAARKARDWFQSTFPQILHARR